MGEQNTGFSHRTVEFEPDVKQLSGAVIVISQATHIM